MGLRALLYAYIIGGLTFVPLLIAAIVIPAWYLLPRAEAKKSTVDNADVGAAGNDSEKAAHARKLSADAAASGTYAVLRRYDFQAALSALNGRQNGTVAVGGNTIGDDQVASEGAVNAPSGSVYQSMYRSVFTGSSKNSGSTTSLLHDQDDDPNAPRRRPAAANLLYIVLRHGHLMLYDSPAQVEVKHVLSLAHHKVSLQAGTDDDPTCMEADIPEADLFTKRTAIVLTPMELPNGAMQAPAQAQTRPFYLFTATNIEKEDFYHALVSNRSQPPTPRFLNPDALIKLQSSLHSSSLTAESRAIDALIGRVFLALHRTEAMNTFIRSKLERKLNRIQKPAFIPSLLVQSIHLGDAGPVFSNLKLRDLNIDGEMTLTADFKYNGGLSVTLLAVAKLDLGSRFKVRTVDLALKTAIQRITGTMLLRIKPPPSNRIWFCFENIPELDVRVEPVVSERKITYGFVLRAIEERVRIAFKEGLVKPNWDDIPMPFSDTTGTRARGGLWSDLGSDDHQAQPTIEQTLAQRNEKTMSLPALVQDTSKEIDSAASTGADATEGSATYRVRQSATMPVEPVSDRSPRPPRPLRTTSVSSPAGTAIDDQNVGHVRRDDATLSPPPPRTLWRARGTANNAVQKDALEELRVLQTRAGQASNASGSQTAGLNGGRRSHDAESELTRDELDGDPPHADSVSPASTTTAHTRTPSVRSRASTHSAVAPSIQGKKANILAATVNATTAAKNWSWNAIQRNKGAIALPERKQEALAEQPMGRGMPLPPPGQPLPGPPPGPQKGIWGTVSSIRRRPVALPQDSAASPVPDSIVREVARPKTAEQPASHSARVSPPAEEEFQPWQENSGNLQSEVESGSAPAAGDNAVPTAAPSGAGSVNSKSDSDQAMIGSIQEAEPEHVSETGGTTSKKVAPPLPARRNRDNHLRDSASTLPSSPASSTSEGSVQGPGDESTLRKAAETTQAMAEKAVTADVPGQSPDLDDNRTSLVDGDSVGSPSPDQVRLVRPANDLETSHVQTDSSSRLQHDHGTIGARDFSSTEGQKSVHESATPAAPGVMSPGIPFEQATSASNARASEDKGPPDAILARMQARVAQRRSAEGRERSDTGHHKTSPSIGFSDGWPSH